MRALSMISALAITIATATMFSANALANHELEFEITFTETHQFQRIRNQNTFERTSLETVGKAKINPINWWTLPRSTRSIALTEKTGLLIMEPINRPFRRDDEVEFRTLDSFYRVSADIKSGVMSIPAPELRPYQEARITEKLVRIAKSFVIGNKKLLILVDFDTDSLVCTSVARRAKEITCSQNVTGKVTYIEN